MMEGFGPSDLHRGKSTASSSSAFSFCRTGPNTEACKFAETNADDPYSQKSTEHVSLITNCVLQNMQKSTTILNLLQRLTSNSTA